MAMVQATTFSDCFIDSDLHVCLLCMERLEGHSYLSLKRILVAAKHICNNNVYTEHVRDQL